jgi:type IV pilus assembly protein PilN
VKALPEGVHLTEVKQTGNRIEFQGVAQSSTRVSTLMRNIDASEFLSDPSLDGIQTVASGQEHVSQFKLFAQQVSTANEDEAKPSDAKPSNAKPGNAKPGNAKQGKGAAK